MTFFYIVRVVVVNIIGLVLCRDNQLAVDNCHQHPRAFGDKVNLGVHDFDLSNIIVKPQLDGVQHVLLEGFDFGNQLGPSCTHLHLFGLIFSRSARRQPVEQQSSAPTLSLRLHAQPSDQTWP